MDIYSFTVGPFSENTYLLIQDNEALLIDPGFTDQQEYETVKSKLRQDDATLQAIVLTHAHVDHVLGISTMLDDVDVPVYLSDKDRWLWNNFSSQASMFGFKYPPFSFDPKPLPVKSDWQLGNFTFDVRHTPGHAPDHLSLYHKEDGILLAGDALFREGIGRTDLYKGDMQTLKQSIRQELYPLADDTVVYPGHGPKTTIGHEKESNPFVQAHNP